MLNTCESRLKIKNSQAFFFSVQGLGETGKCHQKHCLLGGSLLVRPLKESSVKAPHLSFHLAEDPGFPCSLGTRAPLKPGPAAKRDRTNTLGFA